MDGVNTATGFFSALQQQMSLLLLTQYFDMVRDVGQANHCRTTFVPTSKTVGDEMRSSLIQASAADSKTK